MPFDVDAAKKALNKSSFNVQDAKMDMGLIPGPDDAQNVTARSPVIDLQRLPLPAIPQEFTYGNSPAFKSLLMRVKQVGIEGLSEEEKNQVQTAAKLIPSVGEYVGTVGRIQTLIGEQTREAETNKKQRLAREEAQGPPLMDRAANTMTIHGWLDGMKDQFTAEKWAPQRAAFEKTINTIKDISWHASLTKEVLSTGKMPEPPVRDENMQMFEEAMRERRGVTGNFKSGLIQTLPYFIPVWGQVQFGMDVIKDPHIVVQMAKDVASSYKTFYDAAAGDEAAQEQLKKYPFETAFAAVMPFLIAYGIRAAVKGRGGKAGKTAEEAKTAPTTGAEGDVGTQTTFGRGESGLADLYYDVQSPKAGELLKQQLAMEEAEANLMAAIETTKEMAAKAPGSEKVISVLDRIQRNNRTPKPKLINEPDLQTPRIKEASTVDLMNELLELGKYSKTPIPASKIAGMSRAELEYYVSGGRIPMPTETKAAAKPTAEPQPSSKAEGPAPTVTNQESLPLETKPIEGTTVQAPEEVKPAEPVAPPEPVGTVSKSEFDAAQKKVETLKADIAERETWINDVATDAQGKPTKDKNALELAMKLKVQVAERQKALDAAQTNLGDMLGKKIVEDEPPPPPPKKEVPKQEEIESTKLDIKSIPDDLEINIKAKRAETGEEITIKENAKKALSDIDGKLDLYKRLMACLKA